MNYEDIITAEPAKRGGQPCIRAADAAMGVASWVVSRSPQTAVCDD